ncbi:hypothetical protein C1H46_042894 [Malus baccata]|uniref:Uncharacterized protein n=1 Tax=Malus baccata TaxID=106549 RepID=A0A540KBR2_MALBA|nr:hypothetical protein C1H46_042894 [Malus baccata]
MAEEQQITTGEQVPDDEPLPNEQQTPEEQQVPSKQKYCSLKCREKVTGGEPPPYSGGFTRET